MNYLAVWYLISHAVNPPWVKIFQSSMSMVDVDASSTKITSVDFVIMYKYKERLRLYKRWPCSTYILKTVN